MKRFALVLAILATLTFVSLPKVRSERAVGAYFNNMDFSETAEVDGVCESGLGNSRGPILHVTDKATSADPVPDSRGECFQNTALPRANPDSLGAGFALVIETPTPMPYPAGSSSQPYPGTSPSQPLFPCLTAILPAFLALFFVKRQFL